MYDHQRCKSGNSLRCYQQTSGQHTAGVRFCRKVKCRKSSLINALMNRKAYARTSSQPGKTRPLTFTISIKSCTTWIFLDMVMPRFHWKPRKNGGKMIERYLRNSAMLKLVFLLIDIRHEPSANDKMMYDWIIYNGYHPG